MTETLFVNDLGQRRRENKEVEQKTPISKKTYFIPNHMWDIRVSSATERIVPSADNQSFTKRRVKNRLKAFLSLPDNTQSRYWQIHLTQVRW